MRLAAEVYEAAVMPRDPDHPDRAGQVGHWLHGLRDKVFRAAPPMAPAPGGEHVVADIVVIDLRNGAELVEISVTGAQVSSTLARMQEDLDTLSVESFDEAWGLL